ncbi:MAG: 5'/3'-nucleotidase SurE [Bacilli bacterium]|nr:5'/3'-nucleotidase SurE [Bacilli bacterium]
MRILIVNDDSITSPYLKELARLLKSENHEVMVVAPLYQQSAKSHALTLGVPMKLEKREDLVEGVKTYSLDASPATCTKFAYVHLDYDFDLVVSGCNNGLNMGDDIIYSGTVAGASEAAFFGKKGLAVSVEVGDMEALTNNFINVFNQIIESEIFNIADTLNINIPRIVKGLKITHQGLNTFDTEFIETEEGFLATGKSLYGVLDNKTSCDLDAYYDGYVSVTPITVDRTDYNVYNIYDKTMFK